MMFDVKEALDTAQRITLAGMKSGEAIGFREGMLRAAKICEERAGLHARSLPLDHHYMAGDVHQAATCGRRDECTALAREIRDALKGTA